MSREFIPLSGVYDTTPDGKTPLEVFMEWRNKIIAEKGDYFYERLMNGLVYFDGTPTEEAIRASEELDAWEPRYRTLID